MQQKARFGFGGLALFLSGACLLLFQNCGELNSPQGSSSSESLADDVSEPNPDAPERVEFKVEEATGRFLFPSRFQIDSSGNFYVLESRQTGLFLVKYDSSGQTLFEIERPRVSNCTLNPHHFFLDANQRLHFMSCDGEARVLWNIYRDGVLEQSLILEGLVARGSLNHWYFALDSAANVIAYAMLFKGSSIREPVGERDFLVQKFGQNGQRLWEKHIGRPGVTVSGALTVDDRENVYVHGSLVGTRLDGSVIVGNSDGFLIKYNSAGTEEWSFLQARPGLKSYINSLSFDAQGSLFVGATESNATQGVAVRALHLNPAGQLIWQTLRTQEGRSYTCRDTIYHAESNSFLLIGDRQGLNGDTDHKGHFAEFDAQTGQLRRIADIEDSEARDIRVMGMAVSPNQSLYVIGYYRGRFQGLSFSDEDSSNLLLSLPLSTQ